MKLTSEPLHEQLACYGYFGFGSGVQLALLPRAVDTDGALYCNRCPQGPACWQRHRDRVRVLLPEVTKLADAVARSYQGKAYIREYARLVGQSVDHVSEPYLVVMMGNMEDGATIANDGAPKDRSTGTLVWPLTVLT